MNLVAELAAATAVARAAADLVMAVYAHDFAVQWKRPQDPVTQADQRANALILSRLHDEFPADAICAEECAEQDSARAASRGGRCWFVDPLDGTREFVRKSGEFCVMVGLAVAGRPVLGVVVAPAWGRAFAGVVGEGAYELMADGSRRPLLVRAPPSPAAARIVLSRLHRNSQVDAAAAHLGARSIAQCGSTGLKFLLVAAGQADLYLHTGPGPKLWDGCAPEAIALAAGAQVTDAQGRLLRYDTSHLPLDGGVVVAAAPLGTLALQALSRAGAAGEAPLGAPESYPLCAK